MRTLSALGIFFGAYTPRALPWAGMTQTFGEIEPAQKHAISHRARAFQKFLAATGLSNLSEP